VSAEASSRRHKTFAPRLEPPLTVRVRRKRPARPVTPIFDPESLRNDDGGRPLEPEVRRRLEESLRLPLGHVRIHTDDGDRRLARSLGARAFTHRHHIWLGPHESASDLALLAHEVTHVAQQGFAPRPAPAGRAAVSTVVHPGAAAVAVARPVSPAAAPAARAAAPAVQRFELDLVGRARRTAGAVASGVRGAVGAVKEAAGELLKMGKAALLKVVERIAPELAPLVRDGIGEFVKKAVSKAFKSLFKGALSPFRSALSFVSGLGSKFSEAMSWFSAIGGQLARNDCSGILAAARRVGAFFSRTFGPVMDKVRAVARKVSGFFKSIWESVGAPVMNFLKSIGGPLWESIKKFLSDLGAIIGKVKNALGEAWKKAKDWLGIKADEGTDEGGGLWNWIKEKAKGIWDGIMELLAPVMGPLKTVGTVLLAISPAGPILAVIAAWPHLQRAFAWVQQAWSDLNLVVRARQFFANTVLPAVIGAAERVGGALLAAANWLVGLLSRVSQGVGRAAAALSGGILAPLGAIVNFANQQFQKLLDWARSGLKQASTGLRTMFSRLVQFLQPILEVLKKLIAIAVNPFGIPGLLLGTLWRIIPECLKGPIIDFIVDVLLLLLEALPPMPMLGPLFPFVKAAMIGFLQKVKGFPMERKVAVSNKVAKIISGGSAAFAFGYLKGLALGVWEAVIGPIRAIGDLFELPALVKDFLDRLKIDPRKILGAVDSAMGSLDSVLEAARDLLQNPSKVIDMLKSALDAALAAAGELGATIAGKMMELFEQPEDQIGELLGKLVGEAAVNAVLTFFTAGGAAAASAISKVAQILGRVAKAFMKVVRQILKFLPKILKYVRKVAGQFSKAGSKAGGIIGKIKGFIRKLMAKLRKLLKRRKKKGGGKAKAWRKFKAKVKILLARNRLRGIAQAALRAKVNSLRARYRKGVTSASVKPKRGTGYLKVKARPRKIALPYSGKVLMDKPTRWRLGAAAIKKRLRKLKKVRVLFMFMVKASLKGFKKKFGYRSLGVDFDRSKDVFKVTGAMSPGATIGKVPPKRPTKNRFAAFGGRAAKVDPLVEIDSSYAAPASWAGILGGVRPIRTVRGRTSLYIRGHLVSGWLGGKGTAANLTPLTRSANALMSTGMEKTVKELAAANKTRPNQKKSVWSYTVTASGVAGVGAPTRWIRLLPGTPHAHAPVPHEALLPRSISMVLKKKKYEPNSGKWVPSTTLRTRSVANVPPFPPGYVPPTAAGGATPAGGGAAPAGGPVAGGGGTGP